MSVDWTLKLIALLHDPPDKVLGLEGHEGRALISIEQLIGKHLFQQRFGTEAPQLQTRSQRDDVLPKMDNWKRVKKADAVASAMDRAAFPFELQFRLTTPPKSNPNAQVVPPIVRHPLSGREVQLGPLDTSDVPATIAAVLREVIKIPESEMQKRYLYLWRSMVHLLHQRKETGDLGANWHLLPADTRIVDHTLWDHLSMTAALATALPHAALLVCSIGPVQDFIRTARRTQDLWMASYILSYLAWCGIKMVANEFGPDAVLYPSLRGQPLVDHWLWRLWENLDLRDAKPCPEALTCATLPNKFVALLPAAEATGVAERVAGEIRSAWEKLADEVMKWLKQEAKVTIDSTWEKTFSTHKQQMPEIYWSIHRWPDVSSFPQPKDEADAGLREARSLLRPLPDWEYQRIYAVFCATAPKMVNIGTIYSCLYDLAQRGFESRKRLRDFVPIEERGEKCTQCGVRAALHIRGQSTRDYWKHVASQVRQVRGEYVTIKPNGRERLCGVCTAKRLVQRGFFEKKFGLRGGFPSTSSVAAASFKAEVLEELTDARLESALQAHTSALQQLGFNRFANQTGERLLPRLATRRSTLSANLQDLVMELLCYDGDAFYDETFTVERLREDYYLTTVTQTQVDTVRRTLQSLLAVCHELGIDPPAKYFAVLMLDGDEMGKWLSGEKAPLFSQALHPEAAKDLRDKYPAWNAVLDSKRVLSPALHAAISSALANFALHLVPLVVEQHYCGRVVYAGGDDVLALLPVDQVLPAARELRALFSGEAGIDTNHGVQVHFRDPEISGFLTFDGRPLMTMGPIATASVGIAIAHHLAPLDAALAAARRAEKSAKENYERNALCIHFLKRSGEELRTGAQWYYRNTPNDTQDTVGLLTNIQQRFAEKQISMKFVHAVFDEARTLEAVPNAYQAELYRLLKRHHGAALSSQQGEHQATELAPRLAQLACSLDIHCTKDDPLPDEPQPGMVELAKWLLLLRFLSQGGAGE